MANLLSKLGLLRGLVADGGRARTGPFFVTLDVTRRCNLGCRCCRYHSPEFSQPSPGDQEVLDIPKERVDRLLGELSGMGTAGIVFIGEGEPLLHPRIGSMVAAASRAGFQVAIDTNGTRLDSTIARQIVEGGVDSVVVSLWGATPDTAALHSRDGSSKPFEAVVRGLDHLASMRREIGRASPRIRIHQPLTRFNFEELDRLADLACRYGCDAVSVGPLRQHRGRLREMALTTDQQAVLVERLRRWGRRLAASGIAHNVPFALKHFRFGEAPHLVTPCYVGFFHARIKVDGTVLPCNACDLAVGSLAESGFREIWNGEAFRGFRRHVVHGEGLAALGDACDCGFCCHLHQNLAVHRRVRWLRSLRLGPAP
jgi:MoaA/NifB/PqqE/SkfB family radical SAM enzyme